MEPSIPGISFGKQFGLAIKSYSKALLFILYKGLWKYCLFSILVAVALVFIEMYFTTTLNVHIEQILRARLLPDFWSEKANALIAFFVRIGVGIAFYFIYQTINKYILLLLLSPLMALLSNKTASLYSPQRASLEMIGFLRDILRGIVITLRNMFIELVFSVLGLFLIYIPIVGWIFPFFLFALSCYFYGFSMMDYTNERRKMGVSQSISYVKSHKGIAIGNGFIFLLLFAIPYIGVILAASFAPVAATIAIMELEKGNGLTKAPA